MPITLALRPYQVAIGRAVMDSVMHRRGLTFTVEIARQGGKNELSAQLEVLLLTRFMFSGGDAIKAAPTFRPQGLISLNRLRERLRDAGYGGLWSQEHGYIVRLGRARQLFLSADGEAHVVGATARLLLEIDEAQDVDADKYHKELRPMGASTNVTTVLWGTPWDDICLLEQAKQQNLALEAVDGIRRHFQFDWQEVARHNPDYLRFVEGERARLGEEHPLFRTQYRLLPLSGGGRLLSSVQRAQLAGDHPRLHRPRSERAIYVAGIDLAGESETAQDAALRSLKPRQDSTVVTIGELDFSAASDVLREPVIRVVEHYWWTGRPHPQLYPQLLDLLKNVWRCRRVVVDASGVGLGVSSFLKQALGGVVVPFQFTAQSKSELGFRLLAAISSGRLKVYAPDGSEEASELWREIELARSVYLPSQRLSFSVDPREGHDDFVMSLALLVEASRYTRKVARGHSTDPSISV